MGLGWPIFFWKYIDVVSAWFIARSIVCVMTTGDRLRVAHISKYGLNFCEFTVFEKYFEEELLNLTGRNFQSEISQKIWSILNIYPYMSDHEFAPDVNGLIFSLLNFSVSVSEKWLKEPWKKECVSLQMSTKSSAWQAGKKRKKIKNKKSYANIAHKSKVLIFTEFFTRGKSSSDAEIL